jgi:putative ABC transport system permease protein
MRTLRYAIRALAKSPGLVTVATLSLSLGVGVNTALYTVFRTVFLAAPTAIRPERLVRIEPGNSNQVSYPNFRDLNATGAFDGLAAYAMTRVNLRSGDGVEKIAGMLVSPTFFEVLGVHASLGRTLSPAPADEASVVITDHCWRRRLGGRSDPIGVVLHLNGHPYTVVGVLPTAYRPITGALGPEIYLPISGSLAPAITKRREAFLTVIARLRDGTSLRQAELAALSEFQALEHATPGDNLDIARHAFVFPIAGLGSWRTRDLGTGSIVAMSAVPFALFGLVLAIGCANVAGLLVARGSARRRETAIRLALGASRRQVMGVVLAESLVLSVLGTVVGLLLTYWLAGLAAWIPLPQAPGPLTVTPDLSVTAFAMALACIITLASGLVPAIALTSPRSSSSLNHAIATRGRRPTARGVLVSSQVALATVLLFVSMLVLRSLAVITGADTGFDVERLAVARIDLDRDRYPEDRRWGFASQAIQAVRSLPGVTSVTVSNLVPLGGDVYSTKYEVQSTRVAGVETFTMNVGPDYFRTMGIRLRRGREFSESDTSGTPALAIVNEAFVRAYELDPDSLGARARSGESGPWLQIAGVVADSKYAFFGEPPHPILYRPFRQAGGALVVIARTSAEPAGIAAAMTRKLSEIDSSALIESRTMKEATSLELTVRRIAGWLLGVIGTLGLGLSLTGLYGLLSYVVVQRSPEIGLRMALGAAPGSVQWMILRHALRLVGVGLAAGTALSLVAVRPMAFLLSGVPTWDPWTIAGCTALLLSTGLAAAYAPSSKATRVDPIVILRHE